MIRATPNMMPVPMPPSAVGSTTVQLDQVELSESTAARTFVASSAGSWE
jgi:hypothetical protein